LSFRYKIFLIVVGCLFLQLLNAQNFQKVDSLELALGLTANKKDKIEILLKLSDNFQNNNPEKALVYAHQAFEIAEENDDSEGIVKSCIHIAVIYSVMTNIKLSLEFAVKANDLAKMTDMKDELAKSYQILGNNYIDLGEYKISSEYLFKCLKIFEDKDNKKGIEQTLLSIGCLYFEQNNYDKALEYFLNSFEIAKEINDSSGILKALNNVAAIYGSMNEYEKVEPYLFEALKISKASGNKIFEGLIYLNIGVIYKKMNKNDSIYYYFKKAEAIFTKLNNIKLLASVINNLSEYYFENKIIIKSREYAQKAFDLGCSHDLKKIVYAAAKKLYKIYLLKNDLENANKFLIIQYQVKDSMNLEQSLTNLSKLELKYEFYKKAQEKKIEQQRKDFIILIIIISLISGLIVIVLIFARQRIKAKNIRLEKQKIEVELDSRNKEFTTNVMYMMKKNEMLYEISENLIQIENDAVKDETKAALKKIANKLQKNKDKDIWEEFELRFNQVHIDFYKKLTQKFPELTSNDLRLCAFLKLNMSSKEISDITGQRIGTLEMARSRIRKKLGISKTQIDLITFLSKI